MAVMPESNWNPITPNRRRMIGGIMLILIGLLALAAQLLPGETLGTWIVLALGVMFAVWGLLAAEIGMLFPGGILIGVGVGIVLQRWLPQLDPTSTGAVFLFSMAGGWALITPLTMVLRRPAWWPLIVGAVLALVGLALMLGGPALTALEWVGKLWPLVLVAIGGWILYRVYSGRR